RHSFCWLRLCYELGAGESDSFTNSGVLRMTTTRQYDQLSRLTSRAKVGLTLLLVCCLSGCGRPPAQDIRVATARLSLALGHTFAAFQFDSNLVQNAEFQQVVDRLARSNPLMKHRDTTQADGTVSPVVPS